MDVYEIRWRNFRSLVGHHGGISDAAERLGKSQGQVSHFGGERPIKNIGPKIAREIEAAFGKPHGWLDAMNSSDSSHDSVDNAEPSSQTFNPASVAEAEKWVRFEEGRGGEFHPLRRAERLIALYTQIEADGGSLSPDHAEEIIKSQGAIHDAPEKERAERKR